MKENPKCYMCIYCRQCDKEQEKKCKELKYILFATEEDEKLCNLMCGEPRDEN